MRHDYAFFSAMLLLVPLVGCSSDDDDTGSTPTTSAETDAADETGTTDDPSGTTDDPSSTTDDPSSTTDEPTTDPTTTPSDDTSDTNDDMGETDDDTGESALSFATDVWPILDASCSCHKTASGQAGLTMSAATAYGNLVNAVSTQAAPLNRVEPFEPENSYMFQKLTNTHQTAFGSMPPSGMLPQASLDTIEQWIEEGAEP